MEANFTGHLNTQAAVFGTQLQAAKIQEKLISANYEERIRHLKLENALVAQNCDLK
jgi:hypothetical protein